MKKVTLFLSVAALAFSFTSCKKDYTCKCTGSGGWSYDIALNDYKKKDAEDVCTTAKTTWAAFGASCSLESK